MIYVKFTDDNSLQKFKSKRFQSTLADRNYDLEVINQ